MKLLTASALFCALCFSMQSQAMVIPADPSTVQVYFTSATTYAVAINWQPVMSLNLDPSCQPTEDCANAIKFYTDSVLSQAKTLSREVLIDTKAADAEDALKIQGL